MELPKSITQDELAAVMIQMGVGAEEAANYARGIFNYAGYLRLDKMLNMSMEDITKKLFGGDDGV